jgi:hypothetical protein
VNYVDVMYFGKYLFHYYDEESDFLEVVSRRDMARMAHCGVNY